MSLYKDEAYYEVTPAVLEIVSAFLRDYEGRKAQERSTISHAYKVRRGKSKHISERALDKMATAIGRRLPDEPLYRPVLRLQWEENLKPTAETIEVPDCNHGESVVATVSSDHTNSYVLVKCYQNEDFVFGQYYPVENHEAELGPLGASTWPSGSAKGLAEHGYYTRGGFGRWVVLASTTFDIAG